MQKAILLCFFSFIAVSVFSQATCDEEFILTNNASVQGDCIQLTASSPSQRGCAWFPTLIDFTMPVSHTMTLSFGTTDGNGADGICMVYQANDAAQCGIGGGGVGSVGIPNSFIIEMDTWDNGVGQGDIPNDHISVNINGVNTAPIQGPVDLGNIEDGADHEIRFDWDPVTNDFQIFFDLVLVISGNYDIVANCFGGNSMVYWGFTSSTGGSSNTHLICPPMPPAVIADAGADIELPCIGSTLQLDGTNSDFGGDFQYSWTTFNGNIVSGDDTPTPTVDESGTYILTVLNTVTNCEEVDEVTVTVSDITATLEEPPFLDCFFGFVTLDGTGSSSGPNITYQWTTPDGNISSENGSTAEVDEPGTYTLTVVYDDGLNICTEEAMVTVSDDPNVPFAFAEDAVLLCDPPTVEIDGSMSSSGGEFSYAWSTPNGSIQSGENSLFPIMGAPGIYELTVTNDFTGCTDVFGIFVVDNQIYPDAIALSNLDLSCENQEVQLDGTSSSQGNQFNAFWFTGDGEIVSGENTLTPTVNAVGTYTLTVENTENGCESTDEVTVSGSFDNPNAEIETPPMLTCVTEQVTLDGTDSDQGANLTYTWSTTDGQIDGPTDGTTAVASAPGTYTLTVLNTDNNCDETATIVVGQSILPPIAEAGLSQELGCGDSSVQLDGTNSSTFPANQHTYLWTTTNGNIVSGSTILTPTVNSTGVYTLEVTNTENGCTSTDEVIVDGDANTPIVNIVVTDTLDCLISQVTLNASASSQGSNFVWSWSTINGNITDATDETQIIVDAVGEYTLDILNTDNNCNAFLTVSVTENMTPPVADIALPEVLNCQDITLDLDASTSSNGAEFTYMWTTVDGNIINGATTTSPEINTPGTYELTVLNTLNNCSASTMATVQQDTVSPTINIATPVDLTCITEQLNLSATVTTAGNNFTNTWSTPNGNITTNANSLTPTINASGTYDLLVTNEDNHCSTLEAVMVSQNTTPPIAEAGAATTLNCFNPIQALGSGNTSTGANFTQNWVSPDGQIIGATDTTFVQVDMAGEYFMTVTNTINGCIAIDSVMVDTNFATPTLSIAMPGILTCIDTLATLTGTATPNGPSYLYVWSTSNGSILSGGTTNEATAAQEGLYSLSVTNNTSGCSAVANTTVEQDENFPSANIAQALELNCVRDSIILEGAVGVASGNFDFAWSTVDGNFLANQSTLMPTIDQAGTYLLQVTDLDNNCNALAAMEVVLNNTVPTAIIEMPEDLTCDSNQTTLDAQNSDQGPEFTYGWGTSDGIILANGTTLTPLVEGEGSYLLVVTNNDNGCTGSDETTVNTDGAVPNINIVTPATLTCTTESISLDATQSDNGDDFEYSWTTSNGIIETGESSLEPIIIAPGTYELEITNTTNGCDATQMVIVQQNTIPPTVQNDVAGILTCTETSVPLNSTGSDAGADFDIQWSTTSGNFVSADNIPNPSVDEPGDYQLLITNTINGCADSLTIIVMQDTIHPVINIEPTATLTCGVPSANIDASASTGSNLAFAWSTQNGTITTPTDASIITVSTASDYDLTVTNQDNGCDVIVQTTISQDTISPNIQIEPAAELNCNDEEITINASASDEGNIFMLDWTSPDGNISANENSLEPIVDEPGTYILQITNTENECVSMASLMVSQDTIHPVIMVEEPSILDCQMESIFIDAQNSSSGSDLMLSWTTINGNILNGQQSLMPEVDASGDYLFEITNTSNGCVDSLTIMVMQDTIHPVINIEPVATLTCGVLTADIDASASTGPNLAFAWSTQNGTITTPTDASIVTVSTASDYNLTVTNQDNGCDVVVQTTVNQDTISPNIQIEPASELNCNDEEITINASASDEGSIFMLDWTSPDGNISANENSLEPIVDEPGTYVLQITNTENECVSMASLMVSQDTIHPVIIIEEPSILDCQIESVFIDAQNSSNGSEFMLSWTTSNGNILNGQQGVMPEVDAPGDYIFEITNQNNGCVSQQDIEVLQDADVPVVQIASTEMLTCLVEDLTLNANGSSEGQDFDITWTTVNGQIQSGENTLMPFITAPGTYLLTILNTTNDCDDQVSITVDQDITPPVANAGNDFVLDCFDPTSSLNGIGSSQGSNIEYLWTAFSGTLLSGEEGIQPEIDASGIFELLVTNTSNGCTDQDQVTVVEDVPVAAGTVFNPLCYGEPGTILIEGVSGGTSPYLYSADDGTSFQSNALFSNLPAGEYAIIVQDANGCEYTELIEVVQPDSLVVAITEPEVTIQWGESHQIFSQLNVEETKIDFIQWEHNGSLSCDTCLNPIATPLETTTYRITVRDENGCEDVSLLRIIVEKKRDVYIPTGFSPNGDGTNDFAMIFSRPGIVTDIRVFELYNRWGEAVFTVRNFQPNDPTFGWDGVFRGDPMNAAVFTYFAEIEFIDGTVEIFKGDITLVR